MFECGWARPRHHGRHAHLRAQFAAVLVQDITHNGSEDALGSALGRVMATPDTQDGTDLADGAVDARVRHARRQLVPQRLRCLMHLEVQVGLASAWVSRGRGCQEGVGVKRAGLQGRWANLSGAGALAPELAPHLRAAFCLGKFLSEGIVQAR